MKKHALMIAAAFMSVVYFACHEDAGIFDEQPRVSPEILELIADQGFSTDGVLKLEEGYLVEGDILMTEEQLRSRPMSMRVPMEEQYHTFNLVNAVPRTITVDFDRKVDQVIVDATIDALARYNSEQLALDFAVAGAGNASGGGSSNSGASDAKPPGTPGGGGGGNGGGGGTGADIIISKAPRNAQYLASAGFPTSGGDPHNSIKVNQDYLLSNNWAYNTIVSIMAHEIGHCIGFRHTDWYDRSLSCGGSSPQNEGQETSGVGATHIPGTPSKDDNVDGNSFMLSCIGPNINRPFTNADRTALSCLYDTSTPCTK